MQSQSYNINEAKHVMNTPGTLYYFFIQAVYQKERKSKSLIRSIFCRSLIYVADNGDKLSPGARSDNVKKADDEGGQPAK